GPARARARHRSRVPRGPRGGARAPRWPRRPRRGARRVRRAARARRGARPDRRCGRGRPGRAVRGTGCRRWARRVPPAPGPPGPRRPWQRRLPWPAFRGTPRRLPLSRNGARRARSCADARRARNPPLRSRPPFARRISHLASRRLLARDEFPSMRAMASSCAAIPCPAEPRPRRVPKRVAALVAAAACCAVTSAQTRTVRAPQLTSPVRIDGTIEAGEWRAATVLTLDRREQVWEEGARGAWGGPEDLSAKIYLAYDSAHLYLAGEVRDNSFVSQATPNRWETGDAIEL